MTNTGTSHLDRLAKPMPVSGKLGVVTLWTMWLPAPLFVVSAYVPGASTWLVVFFIVVLCASVYTARTTNSRSRGRVPRAAVSMIARLSPAIVWVIVIAGFIISFAADLPVATVIAGVLATALAVGMTPIVAAVPPRERKPW
jgi:hypothetical protein